MHEKNKKIPSGAEECVEAYRAGGEETDPQGSWTGVPLDPFEEPVQDADDL